MIGGYWFLLVAVMLSNNGCMVQPMLTRYEWLTLTVTVLPIFSTKQVIGGGSVYQMECSLQAVSTRG